MLLISKYKTIILIAFTPINMRNKLFPKPFIKAIVLNLKIKFNYKTDIPHFNKLKFVVYLLCRIK